MLSPSRKRKLRVKERHDDLFTFGKRLGVLKLNSFQMMDYSAKVIIYVTCNAWILTLHVFALVP